MGKHAKAMKAAAPAAKGRLNLASKELATAMNQQVGNEMHASLQYTAIASWFASENLPELAAFFFRQSDEERQHAMKFVHFLGDAGAQLAIPAIAAPRAEFGSAEEAVALSLDWEETVTQQIYALVEIAQRDRNFIAQRFLDWFVNEQLEEITSMTTLLAMVQRAGESGLFYVEDYLARKGNAIGEEGGAADAT